MAASEGDSAVGAMFNVASRRELPEGGQDGKIAITAKSFNRYESSTLIGSVIAINELLY